MPGKHGEICPFLCIIVEMKNNLITCYRRHHFRNQKHQQERRQLQYISGLSWREKNANHNLATMPDTLEETNIEKSSSILDACQYSQSIPF